MGNIGKERVPLTGCVLLTFVGLWIATIALPLPDNFGAFPVDFDLNKTAIGSMETMPKGSPCVDDAGNARSHGDSWVSAAGCDRNYCYNGWKGNYTLSYGCRPIGAVENRNTINCRVVADSSAAFPYCCPVIDCERRNVTATPTPPACMDISPSSACDIWADELGGCAVTSPHYNITSVYCRLTCSFCT